MTITSASLQNQGSIDAPDVSQPSVSTQKFTLRPLRRSDEGPMELYTADIRVAGPTRSIPHPLPPGATKMFIEKATSQDRREHTWVIDGTKSELAEFIGLIGLKLLDRNQAQIGYWLAPAFWGKGYARETVAALVTANPLRCSSLFAEVFQDNPASARVLTNCGFDYLGDAESYCVARHQTLATWTYSRKM